MQVSTLAFILVIISCIAYYLGHQRAHSVAEGKLQELHSLPTYYGFFTAMWCGLPALLLASAWALFEPGVLMQIVLGDLPAEIQSLGEDRLNLVVNDIKNLIEGNPLATQGDTSLNSAAERYHSLEFTSRIILFALALLTSLLMGGAALSKVHPDLRARNAVEWFIKAFLILCSSIAILTTLGIVLSVLFESLRFFSSVPASEFLFGLDWSPQTAIRADQVGSSGAFGAIPLFTGTLLISFIAMVVAVPTGLLSAIYLSEYANAHVRAYAKPLLEILAGIPTVVYGFFAALVVAPLIRDSGTAMGLEVASESALAAGLVMGIMIIPLVSSLSDDVINAVPQSLRDGAYGLGATQSETIRKVIFPAALPGIVGGILLAVSRAIGETMIVVMAAGLAANLSFNPLDAVTTVTVQIVTLLTGDQEFDSAKTLAAFALGLTLFVITLILNVFALHVVRKYREQYD